MRESEESFYRAQYDTMVLSGLIKQIFPVHKDSHKSTTSIDSSSGNEGCFFKLEQGDTKHNINLSMNSSIVLIYIQI